MEVIADASRWRATLADIPLHDFYHTYDYHRLAARDSSDEPLLFVYEGSNVRIALPFLVSSGRVGNTRWRDAVSVYGYAGPVASTPEYHDALPDFQAQLAESLRDLGIVSLFSRLHPLLKNQQLVGGLGETAIGGRTVAIDLGLPESEQTGKYRTNHRRDIAKLRKAGAKCRLADDERSLREFASIYRETMSRLDAGSGYHFSDAYFRDLVLAGDFEAKLFLCYVDSEAVCGGLFSNCGGIIQYHLGGTRTDQLRAAPSKLLFDTVRTWGVERGMKYLHLGGGLGGRDDSLFRFKRGFSDTVLDYFSWRWVLDAGAYDQACNEYANDLEKAGRVCADETFFPRYRAPSLRPDDVRSVPRQ